MKGGGEDSGVARRASLCGRPVTSQQSLPSSIVAAPPEPSPPTTGTTSIHFLALLSSTSRSCQLIRGMDEDSELARALSSKMRNPVLSAPFPSLELISTPLSTAIDDDDDHSESKKLLDALTSVACSLSSIFVPLLLDLYLRHVGKFLRDGRAR